MTADGSFTVEGVRAGKVLLVGESMGLFCALREGPCSNVDVFSVSAAGAELNVAIGLQRMGQQPFYMTRLGMDPFGERIRDFMISNKLDTSLVILDKNRSTDFMMRSKAGHRDPHTSYFRRNSATLSFATG